MRNNKCCIVIFLFLVFESGIVGLIDLFENYSKLVKFYWKNLMKCEI